MKDTGGPAFPTTTANYDNMDPHGEGMTTWHKGPPPSVGWWPASRLRNPNVLRWWDGSAWSFPVSIRMTSAQAERHSAKKSDRTCDIEWTERPASWPERSRT
jgi:hypothetical protein